MRYSCAIGEHCGVVALEDGSYQMSAGVLVHFFLRLVLKNPVKEVALFL